MTEVKEGNFSCPMLCLGQVKALGRIFFINLDVFRIKIRKIKNMNFK